MGSFCSYYSVMQHGETTGYCAGRLCSNSDFGTSLLAGLTAAVVMI
ncbi:unnamed protein product, partial [Vitis vinifera]|uniref:Uncharacterized protein n=1 Tax=Vitis vinifera TaxID=29760 RepID=D7SNJ1_VITVI